MSIKVTYKESSGLVRILDVKRFYRGIQRCNDAVGKLLADTARTGIMQPPKTGRIYNYKGRKHRASAPMEYPANRSGRLRRNTKSKTTGLEIEFGTANVPYAEILQQYKTAKQRTSNFKKIAPRPYLTLAHDAVMDDSIPALMVSSIQAEVDS